MGSRLEDERWVSFPAQPAGRGEIRLALTVVVVSAVIFLALLPFAAVPLLRVPAFIPAYGAIVIIIDLITAVLLFGQYNLLRWRALFVLACGYLFTSALAVSHALTFPGLLSPTGLLGAGAQSTAWLYMFWHGGFPLFVIGYALLRPEGIRTIRSDAQPRVPFAFAIAGLLAVAGGLTLLATGGEDLLPVIMAGHGYTPAMIFTISIVWGLSFVALVALWRLRSRSILDIWLMVVMCAWIFEIGLSAVFNAGRFDLGFYAGRIYGLMAVSFVLMMLLVDNARLYANLAARVASRTSELRSSNAMLRHEMNERTIAQASMELGASRLRGILDSAMDAIISVDETGRIVLFNTAAEVIFGCPQSEALGAPLSGFIPERFHAAHAEHMRVFGATGTAARRMGGQRVVTGRRRNGEEFPIDASISQIAAAGGRIFTVVLRDVTERVRAEEELRRSKDELRELARIASTAREQEKSRVARELHDELAQTLTALKMDLSSILTHMAPDQEALRAKVEAMRTMVDGAVVATRRISADLRPLMLDDLGLVPAAEWLAQTFKERTGVPCALVVDPPDLELQEPHATAVFRMLQESLNNAAKHAQASRVEVTLQSRQREIRLRVRDDGRGFRPGDPRKFDSFGLAGLRERCQLLDGEIKVDTAPGRGTTIEVRVPLPAAQSGS